MYRIGTFMPGLALAVAACAEAPQPAVPDGAPMSGDTAAVIQVAWESATDPGASTRPAAFWVPDAPESGLSAVGSVKLRSELLQRGIPAAAYRPTGDDTVVWRVTALELADGDARIELDASVSYVQPAPLEEPCRGGHRNTYSLQLRRNVDVWHVVDSWVIAGNLLCQPLGVQDRSSR